MGIIGDLLRICLPGVDKVCSCNISLDNPLNKYLWFISEFFHIPKEKASNTLPGVYKTDRQHS
jgi:hypothetical protein